MIAVVGAIVAMSGCRTDDTRATSTEPSPQVTVASTTVDGVVEITEIVRKVAYYPGCQNESVVIDDTTWWPVAEWADDDGPIDALYAEITSVTRQEPVDPLEELALRVGPPGPGDDVGTLFVYADGHAWYLSESGVGVWLTTAEQTYNWVC